MPYYVLYKSRYIEFYCTVETRASDNFSRLTKHIRRFSLKTLRLLPLQHVQQGLQATQAQRGVREASLFNQLKHPTQANADDLHMIIQTESHEHIHCFIFFFRSHKKDVYVKEFLLLKKQ